MSPKNPQSLRIIAGQWRGRRLRFPAIDGLRPTPDRVRETLFNWLAPVIHGCDGLDAFAGSGALGLEALSRGARHVTFVERDARAVAYLRQHVTTLKTAAAAHIVHGTLDAYLHHSPPQTFQVVWLDPPFHQGLLAPCLAQLHQGWLVPGAWVYAETEVTAPLELPPGWRVYREQVAGAVAYRLLIAPNDSESPSRCL